MTTDIQQLVELQSQMALQIVALYRRDHTLKTKKQKGLSIYQNNLLMTATRSLSTTYPVLTKMLGDDAIKLIAKRLLNSEMPISGDWADWGKGLSQVLQTSELVDTLPFIPDMATLEWHVHRASRAKSNAVQLESLNLIQQCDWSTLIFKLPDHIAVMTSNFPVAALWHAHRPWDASYTPTRNELQSSLNAAQIKYFLIIYQQEFQSVVSNLTEDEFQLYESIQQQDNLTKLSSQFSQSVLTRWLEYAVTNSLLEKVSTHN